MSEPTKPAVKVDIAPKLLIENWRGELDAVALYRTLARHERSEERAGLLLEMAQDEERHAAVMAKTVRAWIEDPFHHFDPINR